MNSNTNDKSREYEFIEVEYEEGLLYTDPCLMNPSNNSIEVVWFTEEEGNENRVILYECPTDERPTRSINADTIKMSRIRGGKSEKDMDDQTISRDIYRHSALCNEG